MGILHHGSLGPVQQPAQMPLTLPSPPRDHSPHCSYKNPVSKWILSMGPMTNPSLTKSQILMFKVLQSSSWPVPMSSLSHPFPFPTASTHSAPVTLGCSQSHQAHFWDPLLKASLSQSISLALTTHLYPHQSLSPEHSSQPGIRFSLVIMPFLLLLYCVPPS